MIPIQELISRIQWDADFGRGDFAVGYYDRLADKIITVPFRELMVEGGDHFSFQLVNRDGEMCSIPWHRVRTVWKDGQVIWQRHKG